MPTWITPEALNGLTVGSLLAIGAVVVLFASAKGWIVFRWQYLSEVALRDLKIAEQAKDLADLRAAAALNATTIATQAETIRDNTATGEGALKLLQTFRELNDLTAGGGT
jgi:hypothetical protein